VVAGDMDRELASTSAGHVDRQARMEEHDFALTPTWHNSTCPTLQDQSEKSVPPLFGHSIKF
jgi:hypothetical protein